MPLFCTLYVRIQSHMCEILPVTKPQNTTMLPYMYRCKTRQQELATFIVYSRLITEVTKISQKNILKFMDKSYTELYS